MACSYGKNRPRTYLRTPLAFQNVVNGHHSTVPSMDVCVTSDKTTLVDGLFPIIQPKHGLKLRPMHLLITVGPPQSHVTASSLRCQQNILVSPCRESRQGLLLRVSCCWATAKILVPGLRQTWQNGAYWRRDPPFFFCTLPPNLHVHTKVTKLTGRGIPNGSSLI